MALLSGEDKMIKASECRCKNCVNACKNPADTEPDDDYWISQFLKVSREQLIREKFVETPIAVIKKDRKSFVMKGLRPKTINGWCVFFKNGLCTIHPVKPFGCKYASCKTDFNDQEEIGKYLFNKWYPRNLADDKLEKFDLNNIPQQREIFAKLK
jgi:Fe-S-cluster containining protein